MNLSLKNVLKAGYVYCIRVFLWEEKKRHGAARLLHRSQKTRHYRRNGRRWEQQRVVLVFSSYLFLILHILRLTAISSSLSPSYRRRKEEGNGCVLGITAARSA